MAAAGIAKPTFADCSISPRWSLLVFVSLLCACAGFSLHRFNCSQLGNGPPVLRSDHGASVHFHGVVHNATQGSVPIVFVAHWLINIAIKLPMFSGLSVVWPGLCALAAILVVAVGRRFLSNERKVCIDIS